MFFVYKYFPTLKKADFMVWIKRILKVFLTLTLASVFFLLLCYKNDFPREKIIAKYLSPESQFIDIDGVRVHVRIMGEGEPIVLLHGSFSSLFTWEAWQFALSPYFRTIAIDLPGHGLTGPDSLKLYTQSDYALLVLRLTEKLDINEFHLVGNSMGGAVALELASKRPDRVLSLGLIDSCGASSIKSNDKNFAAKRGGGWVFTVLDNPMLSKILLSCTPRFLFEMNLKEVYANPEKVSPEIIDRYYELLLVEGNRQATLDRMTAPKESNIDFEKIVMPTLILWGEKDQWIPLQQGVRLEQAISDSNLVVFENAGHVPMEEIPTESVAEYLAFLGVELRKTYFGRQTILTYAN